MGVQQLAHPGDMVGREFRRQFDGNRAVASLDQNEVVR